MKAVFVHLSDIHFGQEKDGGAIKVNDDAKERLIEDAKDEIEKLGIPASGIILTGDIAYSGKRDEYKAAGDWLDRLTAVIGCRRIDIQMVPGNHDIDRGKISGSIKCILDAVRDKGEATLNSLLDNASDRELLYGRFEAYRDFAIDYECDLDEAGEFSSSDPIKLATGRSIRFVRVNSALICSLSDDKGRLILGARQRVLPKTPGEEVIVLTHHPLSWFQDSDDARRFLRKRARLLISGHEHFPGLEVEKVDAERDLMMLAAGATTPDQIDDVFTYKYNVITFEWDEAQDALAVTINPRTWDDEEKCFDKDHAFLAGKSERQILSSPKAANDPAAQVVAPVAVVAPVQPVDAPPENELPAEVIAMGNLEPSIDGRLLQLRFFRELSAGERMQALVRLGAVPADLKTNLDHVMERRLFRMLLKRGLAQAIDDSIAAAEKSRSGKTA